MTHGSSVTYYFTLHFPDDSSKFLREAMQQGYVVTTLVKVLVVGPAGVGKTSLIYLLLRKDPPDVRTSTGCAEREIRVIRIGQESGEWSEISTKEFEEMIAEAVPVLCEKLKAKEAGGATDSRTSISKVVRKLTELVSTTFTKRASGRTKQNEGEVSSSSSSVEGSKKEERKEGEGRKKEEDSNEDDNEEKPTANSDPSSARESKVAIGNVMEKLTGLVSTGKESRRLLDMDLIYLTDSGGQQAYWDLTPVFTHDTSATLFVHRLCERLDEHPLNDLYQRGKQVGPSQRSTLTTAEAFKTMLRGLHEGGKRSKIIPVGTHKDLASDCEETPEEKNKTFAEIASPNFKDDIVYCNESLDEIIFQLNTKNPDGNDKKEASIEKSAKQHKIPIWWFIFQLVLEALALKPGRQVLSKEEVIHVSETLGFSEEELDAALAFFDKLNIFLYKKTVLPGVVFTNAQVPLDKLSKLVEKQYHLRAALADPTKAADHAMTGDWQKFRDKGILTLDFLEEFKEHYVEGMFSADNFLLLLEKLLVVSRLSDKEYFFPAILNMTTEIKINAHLESCRVTNIAPLVVEFPTGWAPPGVYCCSVCHLQSHSGWKVVQKPPIKPRRTVSRKPLDKPPIDPQSKCSSTPFAKHPSVSRNCIEFTKDDRPGSVTLIDNFSTFSVCVNVDITKMTPDEMAEHCQSIKSEIFAAAEAALENTHHEDTHPTMAFLCPHKNDVWRDKLHVARLSRNRKWWICSENSAVFDTLSHDQTLWLSPLGKPCIAEGSSTGLV